MIRRNKNNFISHFSIDLNHHDIYNIIIGGDEMSQKLEKFVKALDELNKIIDKLNLTLNSIIKLIAKIVALITLLNKLF